MHFFVISLRIYKKKKNKFTKKAERERDFKGVADRENKLSRCVPIIFPFLGVRGRGRLVRVAQFWAFLHGL